MGQVSVRLASNSQFLGPSLPIEVRDSSLRLVARSNGAGSLDLPVGLYEVSAVLGDGQRHSTYVDVKEGDPTPVEFDPGAEPATSTGDDMIEPTTSAWSDLPATGEVPYRRSTYTEAAALAPEDPARTADMPELELLEVLGATVVDRRKTRISFQADAQISSVPTATVRVGEHRQQLSLPIGPRTWTPSGACVVKVERTSIGFHAQAWISPERRVANGLQNMLATGYVLEAALLANEATELLRGKYEDPAGAALGALLLHKAGQLAPWESWVENLARDFAWLPDGKVLLVNLRVARGEATPDDLARLLRASEQRLMYAETCSLLIDLLRRWPAERSGPERETAIERLANDAPYIDRDAICLTLWLPPEAA
jgi:hypothetical protein